MIPLYDPRGINAQTDDFILGAPLARERYQGETAYLGRMYPQLERGAQLGNDAAQETIQGQQQQRRQQQEAFDAQRWALPWGPTGQMMQGQAMTDPATGQPTVVMPPGAEDLRRAFVNRALGRPADAPLGAGTATATGPAPLAMPPDAPMQTAAGERGWYNPARWFGNRYDPAYSTQETRALPSGRPAFRSSAGWYDEAGNILDPQMASALPGYGPARTPTAAAPTPQTAASPAPAPASLPPGLRDNGDGTYTNAATGTKFRIVNGRFVRA